MAQRLTKGTPVLARSASEVKNYRVYKKVIPIVMACIAVLVSLIYIISVLYTRYGSFTVSVNKYQQLQYGLSLCETKDFANPTSRLECRAVEEITNIDGKYLDMNEIGSVDGQDSGDNYLCYTFYCKNAGTDTVSFRESINIANMTIGAEKAARVRLITSRNGGERTVTDYAHAAGVDDNHNTVAEPDTTPFYSKYIVMQNEVEDFAPGEIMKYTIVIWLEGNDPECIDNIIGGTFKIDMKFSVITVADLEAQTTETKEK